MKLKVKDYIYVSVQLILFVTYIYDVDLLVFKFPSIISNIAFGFAILGILIILIALLQLNKNLSPFPTPKSNSELIRTGLYKYIRHPIYTGILMFAIGYAIYLNSEYKIVVSIALLILFYFKSQYEEQRLSKIFSTYDEYKKVAGRFMPKF